MSIRNKVNRNSLRANDLMKNYAIKITTDTLIELLDMADERDALWNERGEFLQWKLEKEQSEAKCRHLETKLQAAEEALKDYASWDQFSNGHESESPRYQRAIKAIAAIDGLWVRKL